jgi:peptidoglycan/xylan/chitin deacetylase (PgdA/CDA1 family)
LAQGCRKAEWPFLVVGNLGNAAVLDFVRHKKPGLVILLGQDSVSSVLLPIPEHGTIQAAQSDLIPQNCNVKQGVITKIHHFTRNSDAPLTLGCVTLPTQPYDGLVGLTLKADLISNDMLIQSARSLQTGSAAQASDQLTEWIKEILFPYLGQIEMSPTKTEPGPPLQQRYRPVWKLCMETLLLCSPLTVARNWFRRWRKRWPVLVLRHHLVSDRPHRMGMPTEVFWRQVRFLRGHYRIVGLAEAAERLRSGKVEAPTLALTFDDGYADNFVNLRAVAEETGIPVALFVATHRVEVHREFQHDLDGGTRNFLPLTWAQIRYWSDRGAEFGSHTSTHFDCGSSDRASLEREMVESKRDLESHLGKPVREFAFPFGERQNMSMEAVAIARSTYSYLFSCLDGENWPGRPTSGQHIMRRGLYANWWELELELQSVFNFVVSMRREFSIGMAISSNSLLEPLTLPLTTASSGKSASFASQYPGKVVVRK